MALPFVGPSYALATRKASVQRSINLHLVAMETPSKAQFILQSVPGLVALTALGSEIRGIYEAARRCFVVSGAALYEYAAGAWVVRGTLASTAGPVDFAWGTTQLVIVDGPNGYILTLATNAFGQITDPNWMGSRRVSYLDGYFCFSATGAQQFYLSAIDDASAYDALDFASAESAPDEIVAHVINHRELWLFGQTTTEVWFNAGNPDFPLSRNNAGAMQIGCIASYSARGVDNGVMWLGRDANGSGIVYRAVGYQPQRISTIAVEEALQASTDISQASAYVYQSDGQTFYCINAPGLTSTWCYEVASNAWHERCELDLWGNFIPQRPICHGFAAGMHLVGDDGGTVYRMDKSVYKLGEAALPRVRISPNDVVPMRDRVFYSEFALDCASEYNRPATSPLVTLRWSDDGGITYGNPVPRNTGAIGTYYARIQWTRLGYARDRVWRVDFTDDAPFSIISGYVR